MTEHHDTENTKPHTNSISLSGDELAESILQSLWLAAKHAHLVAYQTGTGVVTKHNGKMAVVPPDPAMYEDLIPPPFQPNNQEE
ncbi:MAG: hypothetical protein OXE93_06320 [bacterium]|nr:hypothetical protein [bacterium]MCY4258588.1 hypothetical protein [bacterium]